MKKPSIKSNTNKTIESNVMNEDLQRWITEEDQELITKKIQTHLKHKKPRGNCQICGVEHAKVVCIKCGKSVCNSCYVSLVGLCDKCLSKETVKEWKHKTPDWKKILGVDWVD